MLQYLDRLKLTPAERRLVVVIAAVVFVVVNYWLVWPRFGDFQALSHDIEELEKKQRRYKLEIDNQPKYALQLKKLQAAGSVLPAGEERIQFRSDMERLAREVGLAVPRWGEVLPERGVGTTTNAFFESISLTMSQVSGGEDQFVEFLHRVGSSNSTIRVKELTLTPGNYDSRAQGKTNLVCTMKLVASVQKALPKTATTATATTPAALPGAATSPSAAAGVKPQNPAGAKPATNAPATAVRTNSIPAPVRTSGRTNPPAAAPPAKK